MNYFRYKIIEPNGLVSSGVIKLPYQEEDSALAHLERQGGTALYVRKVGALGRVLLGITDFRIKKGIERPFQAEFLANMSLMLSSGVTLTAALEEIAGSSERADFKHDIKDMIMMIQGGATFSEAAENYPHIFPKTVLHLIRIGEETGRLDRTLMDASEHLKRIQNIISDTKQALMYPTFVFIAMGGGMIFWFYYVVPKIVGLFQEMDVSLPRITVMLIQVSEFVQAYLLEILLVVVLLAIFMVSAYRKSRKMKKAADSLVLRIPVLKSIVNASSLAFVTEYFSLLLNVGIDIIQSMNILRESVANEVYREKLVEVKAAIGRGEGISGAFKRARIFPPFVVRMINVGEQSGTLPEQLSRIAEDYRHKLSVLVSTIGKLIEPVVLVVAGVIFAIIVGGLFLPIYDLIGKISR